MLLQICEDRTPSLDLHLCRMKLFRIKYFCHFGTKPPGFATPLNRGAWELFEGDFHLSSCIEKILFHFPHRIFDIFHRFDDIILRGEIKGKTSIFCGKSIGKNPSYFRFFSYCLRTMPIIRSKTPADDVNRIPQSVPYFFDRSVYSRRDCEFGHRRMVKKYSMRF